MTKCLKCSVTCTTTNRKAILRALSKVNLQPACAVLIMNTKTLIRRFQGDEEVAYDFQQAGYLAKTKDRDTDFPIILVAADKHEHDEYEIIISVLHELAHLRGIRNEKKAESWAQSELASLSRKERTGV